MNALIRVVDRPGMELNTPPIDPPSDATPAQTAFEPSTPIPAKTKHSGFDRRRGPGRRRTDDRRAAEDGHMNEEQLEFIKSIEEYKRVNSRPFPTWTEVLDLVRYLGYRKVAPVGEFKLVKGRQTPLRTKVAPGVE